MSDNNGTQGNKSGSFVSKIQKKKEFCRNLISVKDVRKWKVYKFVVLYIDLSPGFDVPIICLD